MFFFFFFQAEDGIRDRDVTGVQTCALPIFLPLAPGGRGQGEGAGTGSVSERCRSEERRVGKGVDLGGRRIIKKKKKQNNTSQSNHIHTCPTSYNDCENTVQC